MRAYQLKVENSGASDDGRLSAAEDSTRFYELTQAVSTTGITLDAYGGPDVDKTMLAQAMSRAASGGIFYADTGAANTYVLGTPLSFIMPKALFLGMAAYWYPANSNSGASTVNVAGIGVKAIRNESGDALTGGEIIAGMLCCMFYDPTAASGAGAWKLAPWANAANSLLTYKPAQFTANGSGSTSIPNNIDTKIAHAALSTSHFPGGSTFSSSRFTCKNEDVGLWHISAYVAVELLTGPTGGNDLRLAIAKNGGTGSFSSLQVSASGTYGLVNFEAISLAHNDYVELFFLQNTGTNRDVGAVKWVGVRQGVAAS